MSLLKKSRRKHVGPYEIGKILGEGTFGKVHVGTNIFTKEKVAIKTIKYKNVKTEMERKHLEREKKVLALLVHPNIVKLHKVVDDEERGCCYMILEFVSGGELFDYIVAHGRIKESDARKFIRQMISALEYCHAHLVIHRDLKPENLLLDEHLNIKITDFGLSNIMQPGQKFSTFCGSLHYACPEILRGEEYIGPGVDVWAMGVILYCLVVGSQPWDGASSDELIEQIFTEGLVIPEWVSEECADLIIKMLRVKEKDRITLADMKNHPWILIDSGQPPPSYFPDQNPVSEIDEEIMQQMVQIGFHDTPDARAEILANKKTQLVVTYHLLLQNLPPEKIKQRERERAARAALVESPKSQHRRTSSRRKSIEIKDANEILKRKKSFSVGPASDPNKLPQNVISVTNADEPNGSGDEAKSPMLARSMESRVEEDSSRSNSLTASPAESPRSGSLTPKSEDKDRKKKNLSPIRASANGPPSPSANRLSGYSSAAQRRNSTPVPPSPEVLAATGPPSESGSRSPGRPKSPGRSKTPKIKVKPTMPKLKLDTISGGKIDSRMPLSADHHKLALFALPEDGEAKFGGSFSERIPGNQNSDDSPKSPGFDFDSDNDSSRVGSLPEGGKWLQEHRGPKVPRPILTLEELKKEVENKSSKTPGVGPKRKPKVSALVSPRNPLRKSIKDLFSPDEPSGDPYSPRDANPATTDTSAMFGCSSTSTKPTKEIRERVAAVLKEQNVTYRNENPNLYILTSKGVQMHLEIVKISKFKNMRGIKLSRLSGDVWNYKSAADAILGALNL